MSSSYVIYHRMIEWTIKGSFESDIHFALWWLHKKATVNEPNIAIILNFRCSLQWQIQKWQKTMVVIVLSEIIMTQVIVVNNSFIFNCCHYSGWHRAFDELSFGEFAQESSALFGVKNCENGPMTLEVIWICYDRPWNNLCMPFTSWKTKTRRIKCNGPH